LIDASSPPANGCLNITLSLTADPTGEPGAAYGDVPYYAVHFGNVSAYENGDGCNLTCSGSGGNGNGNGTIAGSFLYIVFFLVLYFLLCLFAYKFLLPYWLS
jgi:hypothetical protein